MWPSSSLPAVFVRLDVSLWVMNVFSNPRYHTTAVYIVAPVPAGCVCPFLRPSPHMLSTMWPKLLPLDVGRTHILASDRNRFPRVFNRLCACLHAWGQRQTERQRQRASWLAGWRFFLSFVDSFKVVGRCAVGCIVACSQLTAVYSVYH